MLIDLKHGPTIPTAAFILGNQLERRGYGFSRHGDRLHLSKPDTCPDNADTLSDAERSLVTKYKNHLLAVVDMKIPTA